MKIFDNCNYRIIGDIDNKNYGMMVHKKEILDDLKKISYCY